MSSQPDLATHPQSGDEVPVGPAAGPPQDAPAKCPIATRRARWPITAGVIVAVGLVGLGVPLADEDSAGDLWASLREAVGGFGSVRWEFLPAVGALTMLHYLSSAVALRAAAGRPLRLREATMVQFVASAANRLTPLGTGGLAVNARYLARRGLSPPGAVGTLTALQVLGAVADLMLFIVVIVAGRGGGAGGSLPAALGSRATHGLGVVSHWHRPALVAGTAAALALAVTVSIRRHRRSRERPRPRFTARALSAMADIRRRSGDLCVLLAASAGTTLMMGLAFAISVLAVPGGASVGQVGELLAAYLVGAAAGQALPVPAGMGSTETALVTTLLAAHVPAVQAVQAVVLFRATTFWAPVPVGTLAARGLRRRGAL